MTQEYRKSEVTHFGQNEEKIRELKLLLKSY